jgi:hypothetical protein
MEVVRMAEAKDPQSTKAAMETLYTDALELYERARAVVTIERKEASISNCEA